MDAVQAALSTRLSTPAGIATGEVPVWNGSTWVRSSTLRPAVSSLGSGTPAAKTALFGDGAWAPSARLLYDSVDAGVVLPTSATTGITTSGTFDQSFLNLMVLVSTHHSAALGAGSSAALWMQLLINGVLIAGTAYNYTLQQTLAATVTPGGSVSQAQFYCGEVEASTTDAAQASQHVIWINGYSRLNHYPTMNFQSSTNRGSVNPESRVGGGMCVSASGAAGVTGLKFFTTQAGNFDALTRISVYGIGG